MAISESLSSAAFAARRPRLNTTWLIFVTTLMLVSIGVVMIYSASAGIAARDTLRRSTLAASEARTGASVAGAGGAGISSAVDGTPGSLSPQQLALQTTSHSTFFLKRQLGWATAGLIFLILAYQIDYERYRRWSPWLVAASFVACVCVFIPGIGYSINGSHRWVRMPGFQLQSSELAKLAIILYMARQLSQRQGDLKSFMRGFAPALALLVVFIAVIAKEPDLGAAFMLGVVCFVMFYVSGMRLVHLTTLFVLAVPAIGYAIYSKPYRLRRWAAFLDPESQIHGSTYQIYQSLIAVSTGGLTGLGLGHGPQKYQFLAEAHTDFIYAVIREELGMVGALTVFGLYAFFIFQGLRVAKRAPDLYGSLLATGVTVMIGFQAFVNMCVVTGLLPTKGLTLPLISYGGSSLVVNCVAVGILMNVSKFTELAVNAPTAAPGQHVPARNRVRSLALARPDW